MVELFRPWQREHPFLATTGPKLILWHDAGWRAVERAKHDLGLVIAEPGNAGATEWTEAALGEDFHGTGALECARWPDAEWGKMAAARLATVQAMTNTGSKRLARKRVAYRPAQAAAAAPDWLGCHSPPRSPVGRGVTPATDRKSVV